MEKKGWREIKDNPRAQEFTWMENGRDSYWTKWQMKNKAGGAITNEPSFCILRRNSGTPWHTFCNGLRHVFRTLLRRYRRY
jgi:hypothetical protein